MAQKNKELLLKDLCARLPWGVICQGICEIWDDDEEYYAHEFSKTIIVDGKLQGIQFNKASIDGNICNVETVKPYLRPWSSMTEEEARDIAVLHGNKAEDILSIKVTDEYIDIILDDGCCSTYTETIWYDEIISSLECFDYINKRMFDYNGLIPMGLAESTEKFNPYKK